MDRQLPDGDLKRDNSQKRSVNKGWVVYLELLKSSHLTHAWMPNVSYLCEQPTDDRVQRQIGGWLLWFQRHMQDAITPSSFVYAEVSICCGLLTTSEMRSSKLKC